MSNSLLIRFPLFYNLTLPDKLLSNKSYQFSGNSDWDFIETQEGSVREIDTGHVVYRVQFW